MTRKATSSASSPGQSSLFPARGVAGKSVVVPAPGRYFELTSPARSSNRWVGERRPGLRGQPQRPEEQGVAIRRQPVVVDQCAGEDGWSYATKASDAADHAVAVVDMVDDRTQEVGSAGDAPGRGGGSRDVLGAEAGDQGVVTANGDRRKAPHDGSGPGAWQRGRVDAFLDVQGIPGSLYETMRTPNG